MPSYPYHLTDKTLTVFIGGEPLQADRSHPQWAAIKDALNDPDTDADYLTGLITPVKLIADAIVNQPRISVRDGNVFFGDEVVHTVLAEKILDIVSERLDLEPWIKFAENCYANPSSFARDELYVFLEKANLPITPDGCFIAYKRVRADYTDMHSGRFDNSVGNVVVMPGGRGAVDSNRFRTCSNGLHFCSRGYLDSFSGPVLLLVKINPADVVSIPSDHNDSKGRCWRYEVVDVVEDRVAQENKWRPIESGYNEQWGYDPSRTDELAELDDPVVAVAAKHRSVIEHTTIAPADDNEPVAIVNQKIVIQAVPEGPIDLDKFKKLVKKHGSLSGVARALGKSAGTIQSWKVKLGYIPE